ncbi:hypothetical protein A2W14_03320 [Candidatus Gottesmanbacteria bacterium RBG_16_37_8]|uniref:Type 4 fimbrial biogenesis protein PilX N-terminal domain-containing protein n=1 Tax=Candidatus Gottesmanbacteria bacterium RBG_16_37_8 TaxID=1798371 RepID=A0A1F5YTP6_9BACT|nr:MAG: hypothetical protein A2W14_03320 [Candidatus Gottesmanbacteria bacterium RBG_16_37_8]
MKKNYSEKGYALVILLFFMALSVTVITAAVTLMIINSTSVNLYIIGNEAKTIAEAGAENAVLRLLRDPQYSGELMTVGNGTAQITITGTNPKTIISKGTVDNQICKIEVIADISNNILTISSWKEIL